MKQYEEQEFITAEFGQMPSDWSMSTIAELGKVVTGSTLSTKQPEFYNGPYKFISPSDLNGQRYVLSTEKSLTEEGLAKSRVLPERDGDWGDSEALGGCDSA